MALRSLYVIDNESLTVIFSTSQTVGDPVINNSDSPNGTQYVFNGGWSTREVTLDDTGGSVDTMEDDDTGGHTITDGAGLVANGIGVEAESLIQLQALDAAGLPTGPVINIVVFSQNGVTGDVWAFASDTPLIPGVEYEKVGGSNIGSADYVDYTTSWIVSVDGTAGDDSMGGGYTDAEGDIIDGADGNDEHIYGNAGADSINGGAGSDVIAGGADADSIFFSDGFGTDTVTGGETGIDDDLMDFSGLSAGVATVLSDTEAGTSTSGANTVDFSEIERFMLSGQNDTFDGRLATGGLDVDGGAGNDRLIGGSGADTLAGGDGNDRISGRGGADNIDGGTGNDFIAGGGGTDSLGGGIGLDTLNGGGGSDTLSGGDGADQLDGGNGADSIDAGDGDDTILVSAGSDTIDGGTGTDTLDLSAGSSLADGTASIIIDTSGNGVSTKSDGSTDTISSIESFVADETAGQTDTITITGTVDRGTISGISDAATGIFTSDELGIPIPFGGPGQPTINQLLSGTYDPGTGPISPKGTYAISGGEEDGAQIGNIAVQNFEEINFDVVCYVRGTRIETDRGEIAIETLAAGDLVMTLDHGLQPIRWIGASRVPATERLAPVRIAAGAMSNTRDLLVSPQHRMLVGGWQVELCFGTDEVLAPAKSLVNGTTVTRETGGTVEYFHILFDRHEIIFAEGAPSESFHPGKVGMETLSPAARAEIVAIFPDLAYGGDDAFQTARTCLKDFEAKLLNPANFGCTASGAGPAATGLALAA